MNNHLIISALFFIAWVKIADIDTNILGDFMYLVFFAIGWVYLIIGLYQDIFI